MKPKDLLPVFRRDQPSIVVEDRIWYIPKNIEELYPFEGFDKEPFFGNANPVFIEYCSGNGAWIVGRAQASLESNYVAVEMKWKRIRKIWSKIHNNRLRNLIGVCGEGFSFTKSYLKNNSIDGVYINFPDPWPKKRHAHRRLIQRSFIEEIARILKRGSLLTITTDDKQYSEQILEILFSISCFEPLDPKPYYLTSLENYGTSYFYELWKDKGKEIRYHRFILS